MSMMATTTLVSIVVALGQPIENATVLVVVVLAAAAADDDDDDVAVQWYQK